MRLERVGIMDRGIPAKTTLEAMRTAAAPVRYLVGTPKGRLTKLERAFAGKPWQQVCDSVDVKPLAEDGELYILAKSRPRMFKERGMRRRLHELRGQSLTRDELLLNLGAAKKDAGRAWHLVAIGLPKVRDAVTPDTFTFSLRRDRQRRTRRRKGSYLLRSNLTAEDPAILWRYYLQLIEVEQAFKELKHDLAIRPIFHQREDRIEAHIFVAFIGYCLHVTLKNLAGRAHRDLPRGPSWRSSPPCKCSTCIYRPPTDVTCSCPDILNRSGSTGYCWTNSSCVYRINRHPESSSESMATASAGRDPVVPI